MRPSAAEEISDARRKLQEAVFDGRRQFSGWHETTKAYFESFGHRAWCGKGARSDVLAGANSPSKGGYDCPVIVSIPTSYLTGAWLEDRDLKGRTMADGFNFAELKEAIDLILEEKDDIERTEYHALAGTLPKETQWSKDICLAYCVSMVLKYMGSRPPSVDEIAKRLYNSKTSKRSGMALHAIVVTGYTSRRVQYVNPWPAVFSRYSYAPTNEFLEQMSNPMSRWVAAQRGRGRKATS